MWKLQQRHLAGSLNNTWGGDQIMKETSHREKGHWGVNVTEKKECWVRVMIIRHPAILQLQHKCSNREKIKGYWNALKTAIKHKMYVQCTIVIVKAKLCLPFVKNFFVPQSTLFWKISKLQTNHCLLSHWWRCRSQLQSLYIPFHLFTWKRIRELLNKVVSLPPNQLLLLLLSLLSS